MAEARPHQTDDEEMNIDWTPLSECWPAVGTKILLANEQWTVAATVCYFEDVDSKNRPDIFRRFEAAGRELEIYDLATIYKTVFRAIGVHANAGWNYQIYNATHWATLPIIWAEGGSI